MADIPAVERLSGADGTRSFDAFLAAEVEMTTAGGETPPQAFGKELQYNEKRTCCTCRRLLETRVNIQDSKL